MVLLGIAVIPAPDLPSKSKKHKIELKKLYEFRLEPPRKFHDYSSYDPIRGVFAPSDNSIYLFQDSGIRVIDRRANLVIGQSSFAELDCDSPNSLTFRVGTWQFLRDGVEILAGYCGSFYRVDPDSLTVRGQVCPELQYGSLSPQGDTIATFSARVEGEEKLHLIELYDLDGCSRKAAWPIESGTPDSVVFNADGSLLAIGLHTVGEFKVVNRTGIQVRRTDTGEIVSEWCGIECTC